MTENNIKTDEADDILLFISELVEQMVGKQFKYKNGNIYTVLLLTNTDTTPERLFLHPIDVVYMGQNGKIWSIRLTSWKSSFTPVL